MSISFFFNACVERMLLLFSFGAVASVLLLTPVPIVAATTIPSESPEAFSEKIGEFWEGDGQKFIEAWNAGSPVRWQETETAGKEVVVHYSAYLNGMKVFGIAAEQIKLEVGGGKLREVEVMFFNKGDTAARLGFGSKKAHSQDDKKGLTEKFWEKCFKEVSQALGKFGKPRRGKIGSLKLRRTVEIWENGGSVFLLDTEENEFVRVLIVPHSHLKKVMSSSTERAKGNLKDNVLKRPNGDVLVGEIPMVDQGGKGYCVPATIERVLRYYGISELDMHKIADLAGTNVGGGTTMTGVIRGLSPVLKKNRLKFATRRAQLAKIRQCVDRGIPMFWCMYSHPAYQSRLRENTRARAEDFEAYVKKLKETDKLELSPEEMRSHGHVCLIIGYNLKTKELCVSDSWGDFAAEQWISLEDALHVTQKNAQLYILER